jgi:cytochrome c
MKNFSWPIRQGKLLGTFLILVSTGLAAVLIFVTPDMNASEKGNSERGSLVYMDFCVPCHGINGDGQGPLGGRLGARDFTKGIFEKGSGDEQIFNTISNGIPPKMPSWKKNCHHKNEKT